MPINFPNSPVLNQEYNAGTRTWIWNGSAWNLKTIIGTSGYSGYSGQQGISGYSGYSGYSGQDGFVGADGASGYSGYSGYSGEQGVSGYSGYSGHSGYSGYSGYSGLDGGRFSFSETPPADPIEGDIWFDAIRGIQYLYIVDGDSSQWVELGLTIAEGISGYSGYSGYSGQDGVIGADGASGYSGYSGYSGQAGSIGVDGASGYSGYSGYSGATGLSPFTLSGEVATYNGVVQSTSGGFRFPDNTTQLTAAGGPISISSSTISQNYTIPAGHNGLSVGPIYVQTGYSVTVTSGQRWVVI